MSDVRLDELPGAPEALLRALRSEAARLVRVTDHAPRFHVRLSSPSGPLFAWYSTDDRGPEVLRHELTVRETLGQEGVLRAPAVLAHGASWRFERIVESEPLEGRPALDVVTTAALAIAVSGLPVPPSGPPSRREVAARARRRADKLALLARSPLSLGDWRLARRFVRDSALPRAISHGSFQPAHVLLRGGAAYVIDWEELGHRPLGWDLMQFWAAVPGEDDRATVFDLAVDVLGGEVRRGLARLRFAALVSRIVSKLAEHPQLGERHPADAHRLLALLPAVRQEALTAT